MIIKSSIQNRYLSEKISVPLNLFQLWEPAFYHLDTEHQSIP